VEAVVYEFGIPCFVVTLLKPPKEAFQRLVAKLKPYGLIPILRRGLYGEALIRIVQKPPRKRGRIRNLPLILFAVTCVTIFVSGYLNSTVWSLLFEESIYLHASFFTAALLAIVGLHELGHKAAAKLRGVEATVPYFIPGPPFPIGFGTLGAVIMQKEPPINRDQLFDLGFSGPITGFIITIIVSIVAIHTARVLEPAVLAQLEAQGIIIFNLPPSLAWRIIIWLLIPEAETHRLLVPPIGLAAWIGFLITYLNLLPAWQLDGGHIARAMFGERGHQITSFIGILVAFLTGFWFFGLLILFLMRHRTLGPLDDISPLSKWRKMIGFSAYAILVLSAIILW
jgi:membrane-associated protease RseP (regulator of RpoE activity)